MTGEVVSEILELANGVDTWDTATLTGFVPEGSRITFEAYVVARSSSTPLADRCVESARVFVSEPIELEAGLYAEPLEVEMLDRFRVDVEAPSQLYWVELPAMRTTAGWVSIRS